jgi:Sortase domain
MWGSRRTAVLTTCVALVAGLVGAVLLWTALRRSSDPPAPPEADPAPRASGVAVAPAPSVPTSTGSPGPRRRGVRDLTRGLVLPEAAPLRVTIPRIHVSSRLVRLGVDSTGAMDVPADPARAGWFYPGPTPGALGPAVIAGHVTWNGSRAVFFQLSRLRPHDLVRVDRADGRTAVFSVRRVSRFEKTRFPTRQVFGPVDHAGLRLITCGGTYDAAAHRYLANVVVFASLVGSRPST